MPRKEILVEVGKRKIKAAYFVSENMDESELKLYKNVIGLIEEPRDIKLFLSKIKILLK